MKLKEKKLDSGKVQVNVTATADDVNRAFDLAEASLAQSLGLRPSPDKSAAAAIAEKLQIRDVDSILRNQAMDCIVPFALDKCSFYPQFEPERESNEALVRNQAFSFKLTVTPKPIYKLKSWEPVEVTVPPFAFDDSQVEEQLKSFTQSYPSYVAAKAHPVEKGDTCKIALEVSQDGKVMEALSTDGRTYVTGQGYMPESFDEQVVGMDVGQTKTFEFEAPDFDESGKETTKTFKATVTIIEIQEEVTPELSDEWLQKNMPMYDSVDSLRSFISSGLERQQRAQYDGQLSLAVQNEWAKRFEGSIPNEAYEHTAKSIDQAMRAQIKQAGMDFDKFVEQQGGQQNYNMGLMIEARETLRRDYALDAIFDHEGLSISDEDMRDACLEINPQSPAMVQREMEANGRMFAMREIASRVAASKWALEHATIKVEGE